MSNIPILKIAAKTTKDKLDEVYGKLCDLHAAEKINDEEFKYLSDRAVSGVDFCNAVSHL